MSLDNFPDRYQQESRKTWHLIHTDQLYRLPDTRLNEAGKSPARSRNIFRLRNGEISAADREALKQEFATCSGI